MRAACPPAALSVAAAPAVPLSGPGRPEGGGEGDISLGPEERGRWGAGRRRRRRRKAEKVLS